jgi:hypothetical protein
VSRKPAPAGSPPAGAFIFVEGETADLKQHDQRGAVPLNFDCLSLNPPGVMSGRQKLARVRHLDLGAVGGDLANLAVLCDSLHRLSFP